MGKGVIYYTDNGIGEPIFSTVQRLLKESGLPIVSTSLKPIDFGMNIVLDRVRSYPTMVSQIIVALENLETENVFFAEHDVLYHKSHFDFTPLKPDVFYYNENVWRWRMWDDKAIRYDGMLPLSCLCCNREFALKHFRYREEKICQHLDQFRSREPRMSRIWGYEPGGKKRRNGGLTDDVRETWSSEFPNIDIRHNRTFSRLKCTKDDFRHQPTNWQEINSNDIQGWDLKTLFNN